MSVSCSFDGPFSARLTGTSKATSSSRPSALDVEARSIARMRTKIDLSRALATGEDSVGRARPFVERLVRDAQAAVGGRMLAYEAVGAAIGRSGSWVRKLIGNQPVMLEHATFENIAAAYEALCQRIGQAAANERRRETLLRSGTHEALEGPGRLVAGPAPPPGNGTPHRGGAPP